MLDSLRRDTGHDDGELEALVGELRVAGLMTPSPQPSPARRAELRAAVLAQRNARARAGVGGFRGAALGAAMVAGGGLVIASAAGGGNPATFVADVVRDIQAPVTRPEPHERPPADAASSASATPTAGTRTALPAGDATQAADPARTVAPPSRADAAGLPEPTTISADATVRPTHSDTKPADATSITVTDARDPHLPAASVTPAAATDPVLSNTAPGDARTPKPSATPTATPAPAKNTADVAPIEPWPTQSTPTPTATPRPTRPKDTTSTTQPAAAQEASLDTSNASSMPD